MTSGRSASKWSKTARSTASKPLHRAATPSWRRPSTPSGCCAPTSTGSATTSTCGSPPGGSPPPPAPTPWPTSASSPTPSGSGIASRRRTLPAVYDYVMQRHEGNPRPGRADQPYFGTLTVELELSEPDYRLGVDNEIISTMDALHEEIYFGTIEFFQLLGRNARGAGPQLPRPHHPRHAAEGRWHRRQRPHHLHRIRHGPAGGDRALRARRRHHRRRAPRHPEDLDGVARACGGS